MGVWLVGQCSKALTFWLKIPDESSLCRYLDDRLIWEPGMYTIHLNEIKVTNSEVCLFRYHNPLTGEWRSAAYCSSSDAERTDGIAKDPASGHWAAAAAAAA